MSSIGSVEYLLNSNLCFVQHVYNYAKEKSIHDPSKGIINPEKVLRIQAKVAAAIDGIIASVLTAKTSGASVAKTTLSEYSLHPKYRALVLQIIKRLFDFTVVEHISDSYCQGGYDFPVYKSYDKMGVRWPTVDKSALASGTSGFLAFQKYREDESFVDVALLCGKKYFPAHRVVLAARSKFFERAFLGEFKDRTGFVLQINIKADNFEDFMLYLYTGTLSFKGKPLKYVETLLACADFFDVAQLRQACIYELWQRLERDTVEEIAQIANTYVISEFAMISSWQRTKQVVEISSSIMNDFQAMMRSGCNYVRDKPISEVRALLTLDHYFFVPQLRFACDLELLRRKVAGSDSNEIKELCRTFSLLECSRISK